MSLVSFGSFTSPFTPAPRWCFPWVAGLTSVTLPLGSGVAESFMVLISKAHLRSRRMGLPQVFCRYLARRKDFDAILRGDLQELCCFFASPVTLNGTFRACAGPRGDCRRLWFRSPVGGGLALQSVPSFPVNCSQPAMLASGFVRAFAIFTALIASCAILQVFGLRTFTARRRFPMCP